MMSDLSHMFVKKSPAICGSHHVALNATLAKYRYSNTVWHAGCKVWYRQASSTQKQVVSKVRALSDKR